MNAVRWLVSVSLVGMLAGCGLLDSPAKQRDRAEAALTRGAYGEAAIIFRNLTDKAPADAGLHLDLARALFLQGRMDAAQLALEKARELGADPQVSARLVAQWDLSAGNPRRVLEDVDNPRTGFSDIDRQYFRARAYQGLQRIPEAVSIYQQLLAVQPSSADLQLRMAQSHAYLGRNELALATLDAALAAGGTQAEEIAAEAWLLKAVLFERRGDVATMRDAYDRAIHAAPGEMGALQQGQLLVAAFEHALRAGDLEQARNYHARLAEVVPQSPLSRLVHGKLQLFSSEPTQGVAELQRLLQEHPDQREARLVLAAALVHVGSLEQGLAEINTMAAAMPGANDVARLQELVRTAAPLPAGAAERAINIASGLLILQQPALARYQLRQAVSQHPEDLSLQRALVQVELRSGRTGEALQLATSLVAKVPDDPVAKALLAEAQAAAGEHAAAAASYQELWSAAPSRLLAMSLAQARERAGLPDATAPLQEWLQRQPRDATVRLRLATALQQSGAASAAIQHFQRLVSELPEDQLTRNIALNNLAILYSEAGDQRALETARLAHVGGRDLPAILDTYGWLLARSGRTEEALPLLKAAYAGTPQSTAIRYHYATVLAGIGDIPLAQALLEDLLQHDSTFEGREDAARLHDHLRTSPVP